MGLWLRVRGVGIGCSATMQSSSTQPFYPITISMQKVCLQYNPGNVSAVAQYHIEDYYTGYLGAY